MAPGPGHGEPWNGSHMHATKEMHGMRNEAWPAVLAGAFLILPAWGSAVAQEDDDTAYVYASYWTCTGGLGDAVATLRDDWGPIMQKHVDAGHVSAWGVLTHQTGNAWSMANYHVGDDLEVLNTALDNAQAEYFEAHPEEGAAFGEACPTHEDYIWISGPGSQPAAELAQNRPSVGMSVYYVCDEGREAVADLIVEEVFGPAYDRQVEAGLIDSWGWLSHYVGGKYRRLLVTDGPDRASVMEARTRVIEDDSVNPALAAEFNDVCNGHQDILWNIAVSQP